MKATTIAAETSRNIELVMAYLVGESSLVLSVPQGEQQVQGKYLGVWWKIGGEWRLTAMGWTGNVVSGKG